MEKKIMSSKNKGLYKCSATFNAPFNLIFPHMVSCGTC